MINLKNAKCIGEGQARLCFEHPDFADRCVKVFKTQEKRMLVHLNREIDFLKKFNKGAKHLDFVPQYYGEFETSEGLGYVFELYKDYTGEVSQPLIDVDFAAYDQDLFIDKVERLYRELLKKGGVLSDFHRGNVLVQKHSESDYDLKIIDGFGNSDFVKICDYSKYFLKKKLDRKFFRFLRPLGIQKDFS